MVAEVSTGEQIQYEVQVFSVLESVLHIHNEAIIFVSKIRKGLLVVELLEDLSLIEDGVD